MPEWLSDTLTLVVIGFVLWALVGDVIRKIGLVQYANLLAFIVKPLWEAVVWCAYKLLLGRAPNEKHLTHDPSKAASVMSNSGSDEQTDRQTARHQAPKEAPKRVATAQLDISRYAVVKILVANAWTVSEIRQVVKGDNGDISAEFERATHELEDEGYRIPAREKPKLKGPPKISESKQAVV